MNEMMKDFIEDFSIFWIDNGLYLIYGLFIIMSLALMVCMLLNNNGIIDLEALI